MAPLLRLLALSALLLLAAFPSRASGPGSLSSAWRIDRDLGFHLATLGEGSGAASPSLGLSPEPCPDITNIPLGALQGLGFPVPGAPEGRTFYMKFYRYPEALDPVQSAARVLEPTLAFQLGGGQELRRFVAEPRAVVVKKGLVDATGRAWDATNPFPPLRASSQGELDRSVVFSSLYVQPAEPAPGSPAEASAAGVRAFHRELLDLYRRTFGAPEDGGGTWRFTDGTRALRVQKEPMVFENYRELPMPQDPKRIFLSGLLLVYEDAPGGPRVFEVGSVLREAP